MSENQVRFDLPQDAIPRQWYNIQADLPRPLPPVLHPGTKQPVGPDDLAPLFPMALIGQEVSQDRFIDIPDEVREIYKLWRPTPLLRAYRLEQALDTPAHIYYKYEGVSPSGSHKLNTAAAQAWYNKAEGISGLTTETGAGQWGTALAQACNFFGLDCRVYMVRISYDQKPYRRAIMQSFGAVVSASPGDTTQAGRMILEQSPVSPGSLGIAISEAVEAAATSGGRYKYALGSVLNHVLMHQTVIGQETLQQMALADEYPDVVVAPVGGGSNFAGIALPFLHRNLSEGQTTRLLGVEPAACPSLTRGTYAYDFGDTAGMTPLVKMYTLGHSFVAGAAARRRPALPRHGQHHLRTVRPGADGGAAVSAADGDFRGRSDLRPQRGHHPGAGGRTRCRGCHPRGAGGKGSRRKARDPLQPLRPRSLRHERLRCLPRRATE